MKGSEHELSFFSILKVDNCYEINDISLLVSIKITGNLFQFQPREA